MKALSKADIKYRVRALLNEAQDNESELYTGNDERQLDADIEDNALNALRYVNQCADESFLEYDVSIERYLESGSYSIAVEGEGATDMEQYSGVSALPSVFRSDIVTYTPYNIVMPHYLRLVRAGANQWKRVVTEYSTFDDAEYEKQGDFLAAGTPKRPKVFVGYRNGDYQAELYSVISGNNTDESVWVEYMVIPEWREKTVLGVTTYVLYVSDRIESAFYYYLAGLILLHLNDQHAEDMFTMANVQMGVTQEKA